MSARLVRNSGEELEVELEVEVQGENITITAVRRPDGTLVTLYAQDELWVGETRLLRVMGARP